MLLVAELCIALPEQQHIPRDIFRAEGMESTVLKVERRAVLFPALHRNAAAAERPKRRENFRLAPTAFCEAAPRCSKRRRRAFPAECCERLKAETLRQYALEKGCDRHPLPVSHGRLILGLQQFFLHVNHIFFRERSEKRPPVHALFRRRGAPQKGCRAIAPRRALCL